MFSISPARKRFQATDQRSSLPSKRPRQTLPAAGRSTGHSTNVAKPANRPAAPFAAADESAPSGTLQAIASTTQRAWQHTTQLAATPRPPSATTLLADKIARLTASLATEPQAARLRYERAEAYLQAKDYSRARDDFNWLLRQNADVFGLWLGRALARFGMGDILGAAIDSHEAARRSDLRLPYAARLKILREHTTSLARAHLAFFAADTLTNNTA